MEPGIPSRIPSIQPIHINRTTKNATMAHTCAPSPKQSTRDWIRIPGEIGWARPVRHPARFAISTSHEMLEALFGLIFKYSSQEIHDHHALLVI